MVLQSWARGPVYACIHQSQDTGHLYEWGMKDMILEDAPLFSQKQSLEGSECFLLIWLGWRLSVTYPAIRSYHLVPASTLSVCWNILGAEPSPDPAT